MILTSEWWRRLNMTISIQNYASAKAFFIFPPMFLVSFSMMNQHMESLCFLMRLRSDPIYTKAYSNLCFAVITIRNTHDVLPSNFTSAYVSRSCVSLCPSILIIWLIAFRLVALSPNFIWHLCFLLLPWDMRRVSSIS